VTVQIGGVTVHGCKMIQQHGQDAWVAILQREWEGDDGRTRYGPIVELSNERQKPIAEAVLAQARL
jgi:hypothetical protein